MKYRIIAQRLFILGLFFGQTLSTLAQSQGQCRLGLHYQISSSSAWGGGQPIITAVSPYSPAERAGLRTGDIIEQIDGIATQGLSLAQISALLRSQSPQYLLKISNFGRSQQSKILRHECKLPSGLTERELAELFSLYSLEDASNQMVQYPFAYQLQANFDLRGARTFAFAPSTQATQPIDQVLNQIIAQALREQGLQQIEHNPDLVFSTYYELLPTESQSEQPEQPPFSWRYDPVHRDMKPLPILPPSFPWASYKLTLGVVATQGATQAPVWSCEAKELLSEAMTLQDYASYSLPIMLRGFPLPPPSSRGASWIFQTLRYNYTGLIYDKRNLRQILSIETNSPAMQAGLLPGDLIRRINGIALDHNTPEELLAAYYHFVERSDKYREHDQPSMSLWSTGQTGRYWALSHYDAIADMLSRNKNNGAFSYLFAFRPYINPEKLDVLVFEIERRGEIYQVAVRPEKRDESVIIPH